MIHVTITYPACKELVGDKTVAALPTFIKFWDSKDFFVAPDEMPELIELCEQKGWSIRYVAVFTTRANQIKRQCEAVAIPEHQEQL